ncbi:MAG: adenosylcobinamide-phosphate synthase CbiB [Candidatus Omnitrophota bacterium]|nr:adenosylcobinamide-phosphate synthase CbiB [Candidatus Omnitrophota bacterium]
MLLLVSAYILDLIIGDPENFPHPVRLIGKLINFLEAGLKIENSPEIEKRIKGIILVVLVVGLTFSLTNLLIIALTKINPALPAIAWIYLGYTAISVKDLRVKAKSVYRQLEKNDAVLAGKELSKIVGRDTENLSDKQIITATVESIAENTNDGIVAPILYLALGGPALALGYKAINTLDSMVGHENDRYKEFGWFSAKLDDVVNYIPARISGFLICICSFVTGRGFREAFRIMSRDGRKHSSPNSGISEAAVAGALGIRLGGNWVYQGKSVTRPYIGEEKKEIHLSLINEALSISLLVSVLIVWLGVIIRWLA